MDTLPDFSKPSLPGYANDKNAGRIAGKFQERGDPMDEPVSKILQLGRRAGMAALLAGLVFVSIVTPAAGEEPPPGQTLVPVGHTVGIKLFARGVLVVKLAEGDTPARACGLSEGDVIVRCCGTAVTSTEQFQSLLQETEGQAAPLEIRRDGKTLDLTVTADGGDGKYAIGAWIRDSMAGIGTMTFYDPDSGVFGALGHGVTDTDTAALMPFSSGSILPSTVKAVKRGERGIVGELKGSYDLSVDTGALYANTECGVFGKLAEGYQPSASWGPLPAAQSCQIHEGKATILANVNGDQVKEYTVEVTKILGEAQDGRNMLLTVTDPALLETTGGIVQGMSGSPILQDGKIIGAVTHVLLNEPTKGYGIFIENMLDAAGITEK